MPHIAFEHNHEDYDKKSLQIGMLVKKNPNNLPLDPFSYCFMNSCYRSIIVPYSHFSEEEISSHWERLISVSFGISNWEYGRGYAKAIKQYISRPALYLVSTHATLDKYFCGNDPHFPKRWVEDIENPHPLWDDWLLDENSHNWQKLFFLPLYVGMSNNAYDRWFVGKHHRFPEIDFLSEIGIDVYLTIYPYPQDDIARSERILIDDLQPPMNDKKYSLKETEKNTLADPLSD